MSFHRIIAFYIIIYFLLASNSQSLMEAISGGLDWETTSQTVEFNNSSSDEKVYSGFKFSNTSNTSVEIISTKASCGCTVATLDKKRYLPGESGELSIAFNPKGRKGNQISRIAVETNQGMTQLAFHAVIPKLATVSPDSLTWAVNDTISTQKVVLQSSLPFKVDSLTSSSENIQPVYSEIIPARQYEITVRPTSLREADRGLVSIAVSFENGQQQTYSVLYRIR